MARPKKPIDTTIYTGRFAARLTMLREKKKLTIEEVAAKLGVQASAVYHWENGRASPNLADMPRIAEALELKRVLDLYPRE